MTLRLMVVMLTLATTGGGVQWLKRPEPVVPRTPLQELPMVVGDWGGREEPLEPKVLDVLGVNDHANRMYLSEVMPPVSLYIGFYATQRTGRTIHSPMKCLPGTGWQPLTTGQRELEVPAEHGGTERIRVNRYVVAKGPQKHVVLFWYQMRGHIVSSEYIAKLYLIDGALRTNRTDGALVRLIVPIPSDGDGGEARADEAAATFIRQLYPKLGVHLPA